MPKLKVYGTKDELERKLKDLESSRYAGIPGMTQTDIHQQKPKKEVKCKPGTIPDDARCSYIIGFGFCNYGDCYVQQLRHYGQEAPKIERSLMKHFIMVPKKWRGKTKGSPIMLEDDKHMLFCIQNCADGVTGSSTG
jgi:hypothetical protein